MELETEENDALYVTAAVMLGVSVLGFLCHLPGCVRATWNRLTSVKWKCFCPPVRDECLSEQICQQKTVWSQKLSWYARTWSTCWTAWIVCNYWTERKQLLMNASGHWFVVIFLALMLLPTHFPRILQRFHFSLDANYIACQLFVAMILSPWTFQPGVIEELVLCTTAFVMLSLPSAALALNSVVVITCQTFIWLLITCRAWTEAMQYPILLTIFGFWHIPIAVLVFQLTEALMLQEAESKIRERDSRIQMNAASALLQLTCDAVLELDTELQLVEDNPNLTTMLLGRPGASLKGRKFSDFISSRDQRRATELLQQDARAIAFHTRLVDSYSSKFRTEVFQVKYTKMNGQKCHLLGLRDFTDVKPLAGDTATDAIRDTVASAPLPPPSPVLQTTPAHVLPAPSALAALPGLRRGWSHSSEASNNSFDMKTISEHSVDSHPPEKQHTLNSGIVEQRVKLSHKEAFLEINLDKEVISAASAPFAALSGQSLTAVFATDFSCHLFHRMCSDARTALERANERGERGERGDLPDQVAAFHKMPLFVSGTLVEVSGIMKVCATFEGHLRVQMCFVADSSKWRGDVCKVCKCSSQWSL